MENPTDHFPVKNGRVVRVSSGNGHSLRTIQRGERRTDSPVFLLIHGLASNARMWDGVGDALQESGYASVAIDLRGHGLSDKPDSGYDFDTVCDDVVGVLDHLSIDRAVFVGQSWGGNVVVHAAHRHPDRVIGSVAVDGGVIELGRVFPDWNDANDEWPLLDSRACAPVASKAPFVRRTATGPRPASSVHCRTSRSTMMEPSRHTSPSIDTC